MSNPGPLRPLSGNPKFNVLTMYSLGTIVLAIVLVLQMPGYLKLLGGLPAFLALWLQVKAVRSGTELSGRQADGGPDGHRP